MDRSSYVTLQPLGQQKPSDRQSSLPHKYPLRRSRPINIDSNWHLGNAHRAASSSPEKNMSNGETNFVYQSPLPLNDQRLERSTHSKTNAFIPPLLTAVTEDSAISSTISCTMRWGCRDTSDWQSTAGRHA